MKCDHPAPRGERLEHDIGRALRAAGEHQEIGCCHPRRDRLERSRTDHPHAIAERRDHGFERTPQGTATDHDERRFGHLAGDDLPRGPELENALREAKQDLRLWAPTLFVPGARQLRPLDGLRAIAIVWVVLPVIGPVYAPSIYGVSFVSGLFRMGPLTMHVTRGIGGKEPLRWNCCPELTCLEVSC